MSAPPRPDAKNAGAYYTDRVVADALCAWALRAPTDRVLDPGFGGGVFLEAAAARLARLGGGADGVLGVELEPRTHAAVAARLADAHGVPSAGLRRADFFALAPEDLGPVDAVLGNPPYVRFQRFGGEARRRASERAAALGVRLSPLASSWAPYLVHACAFLRPGGRLAMVLPFEIGHAAYARPVLAFLRDRFRRLELLAFRRPLFPRLDQGALVLRAEGWGEPFEGAGWQLLEHADGLEPALCRPGRPLDLEALVAGRRTLRFEWLPDATRELYAALEAHPRAGPLGALARVASGYVTGANDFFHLSPDAAAARGLPAAVMRPALFRGRALTGLVWTEADWRRACGDGSAGLLLATEGADGAPAPALAAYLAEGVERGVDRRYKTRRRRVWHRVTRATPAPLVLSAMSGGHPRLVVNAAGAAASNTFHLVRPSDEHAPEAVAAAWTTSLAALSCELEGHVLGGGMLKLEPSEAAAVRLPPPGPLPAGAAARLDAALRAEGAGAAAAEADRLLLVAGLGLEPADAERLAAGAEALRDARRTPA